MIASLLLAFLLSLAPPQPKTALGAAASPHGTVLTWTQSVVAGNGTCPNGSTATGVTSNTVLRGTASGLESILSTSTAPITTFTDTTGTPGVLYFYVITATNCNGTSGPSNEVQQVFPNFVVPNPPVQNPPTAQ